MSYSWKSLLCRSLPGLSAAVCLAVSPARSQAAESAADTGAKFLQMRLPAGVALAQATGDQIAQAVALATAAHREEAPAILTAALTRPKARDLRPVDGKLPCVWVARLLHVAVAAAPGQASQLLGLASSLCPDCADSLETAVELFSDKNVVDDKTVVDDKNGPAAADPAAADPAVASNRNSDPNDLNLDDPQVRDVGFPSGFGPGFPGAPGFVGSPPGGGVALPPPTSPVVTAVMNS